MKKIVGFENLYAVTSCGRVWSYKNEMFLTPVVNSGNGYLRVNLYKDGVRKKHYIHRLVAEAYLENTNNLPTVDHINRDKNNNSVNNLQFMDRYENLIKDCPSKKKQKVLCVETGVIYESQNECAKALGIDQGNLGHVLHGKCKTTGGYHFALVDPVEDECETHESDVRKMMKEACLYYRGHELSKIVKCSGGGRIYYYNDRAYSINNCKDVCDLYEELFGTRPLAIKCADGKYVIYADHYNTEVRQKTIDLCEQILREV